MHPNDRSVDPPHDRNDAVTPRARQRRRRLSIGTAVIALLVSAAAPAHSSQFSNSTSPSADSAELIQFGQREVRSQTVSEQTVSEQVYQTTLFIGLSVLLLLSILTFLMWRHLMAHRKDNAAIAEQAERLRITLASIGDAVITTDAEGRVTDMNAIAESLTGWPLSEATGQPLPTVFHIISEDSRQAVSNPAIRALTEGTIIGLANHTLLVAKDGTERQIDDSAAPIRSVKGEIVGCVLIFRDVSDRYQQEIQLRNEQERLKLALSAADSGQWDLNLLDGSAYRNLRHDQIFGHDSLLPEWTYDMFLEHVLPADRPFVDQTFQQAIAAGTAWDCECQIRTAKGIKRWVWVKGKVQQNANGQNERMLGLVNDITRRKQAEAEIQQARSRLASILAASEIGTWELDLATEIIKSDLNMAKMFGLPPAAAAAAPRKFYRNVIHPDDRERVTAVVDRSLITGEDYETRYRITRPEGTVRWVIARGRIEQDRAGQAVRVSGVVVDITAQREAEDQLRASEVRFRQLADVMPQIVWITGPTGANEYYNRRWYEYTGGTLEDGLGDQWSDPIHPEDQQRAIDHWNSCVRSGEPYEIEYRFRSQTGEYRWFLVRSLPVRDETGQIIQWFGTSTDIEDFKRAEEDRQNFVRMADNSTEFIAMCDLSGVPFYINPAGLEKLGIDSMAAAHQLNLSEDLFFPEDRNRIVNEFFPSVLENGTGTTDVRFRHFKTGATLWMVYNVTVLFDEQNRPIGFATISQDITDRRNLEENLRHLAADLSEAGRRKDEFLATLAHELRNPLAPIRNGLQIMRRAGNDTEAADRVRAMMERQINQMVRLIDDLLDVSRISRGKVTLRREQVELAAIIEQSVETSQPGIELARHQLTVALPPQPVYLHADPVRLVQIFSNLLNNASKYSEPAGQIVVSAEQQQQQVAISVKDTGIGISAEMLPKVFGLFTQVQGALERASGGEATAETGGLGIGLTLVKQLVEMHGGTISAFSEGLGQGSEFVVRLPTTAAPAAQQESTASELPKPSNRRILIVDDNEDSALSLAMLFEITGDETQTAHDGLAAVEAAAEFRPDVVLLDIGLPGLNGYEAAQAIREQPWGQHMILIALTGWGQPEDRRKSTEAGFDAHMVKPIDHDDLLQLLDELVK